MQVQAHSEQVVGSGVLPPTLPHPPGRLPHRSTCFRPETQVHKCEPFLNEILAIVIAPRVTTAHEVGELHKVLATEHRAMGA